MPEKTAEMHINIGDKSKMRVVFTVISIMLMPDTIFPLNPGTKSGTKKGANMAMAMAATIDARSIRFKNEFANFQADSFFSSTNLSIKIGIKAADKAP